MRRRIYVGNLPYATTAADLAELFGRSGAVAAVHVARDEVTGRARGFGVVEMATGPDATRAIERLNGLRWHGRRLAVSEATSAGVTPRPSTHLEAG